MNLHEVNSELRNATPAQIVSWALNRAKRPIVTTNFRPYEACILHVVTSQMKAIPVVWCDSGYNTPQTYMHAERTIDQLKLNIDLYVPAQTAAHRNAIMGIPEPDTAAHQLFTEQVKLEPFQRAMRQHKPDVWFTNLRKGQTKLRDSMDIINRGQDGVLKVCPFFYWSDEELETYLESHELESESRYYDPTKALENRECGLHTMESN